MGRRIDYEERSKTRTVRGSKPLLDWFVKNRHVLEKMIRCNRFEIKGFGQDDEVEFVTTGEAVLALPGNTEKEA